MSRVSVWKVVLAFVLVALLIGGGAAIYRAGYARGVMAELSFEDMPFAEGGFEEMMPYGRMPYMRTHGGYRGFPSIGGIFFGGLLLFLIVGGIFRLFSPYRYHMPPPWMMHKMYREGKDGPWAQHPYWGKMRPEDEDESASDEEESEK